MHDGAPLVEVNQFLAWLFRQKKLDTEIQIDRQAGRGVPHCMVEVGGLRVPTYRNRDVIFINFTKLT